MPEDYKFVVSVQEFGTIPERNVAMRVRKENSEFQFLRNQFLTQFEKLSQNNENKQDKINQELLLAKYQTVILKRRCNLKKVFYLEDNSEWKYSVLSRGIILIQEFLDSVTAS